VAQERGQRPLTEALVALAAFCGLSLLSRLIPLLFLLVVAGGIGFPLVWARVTKDGAAMGFTRRNLGPAVLWGLGAGLLLGAINWFTSERTVPPFFVLQLAVGIPVWFHRPFKSSSSAVGCRRASSGRWACGLGCW